MGNHPTSILELCCCSGDGIFAIPYHGGRPHRALRLPDGAIVEAPTPDQRCEAPDRLSGCFEVAVGGVPATIHHSNLGLIKAWIAFEGVYILSSGDVAAVYGARALPLG